MKNILVLILGFLLIGSAALAQPANGVPQTPSPVTFVALKTVVVTPGKSTPVTFSFHIAPGYHVNSHQPSLPELIPTELHFSLPGSDIVIGRIRYAAGELKSFAFDPTQQLSVYSGDFMVKGLVVSPPSGSTGMYTVHGELRYQACDNNACYPPKKLSFTFNVRVGAHSRGTRRARTKA